MKEVALDLFQRHGFKNVSVRDLTGVMGLTAPAIYAHFRSKEDILHELIVDGHNEIDRLMQVARSSVPDDDPVASLAAHIYLFGLFHTEMIDLARLGRDVGYLPEPEREQVLQGRRAIHGIFEEILRRGAATRVFEVTEIKVTTRLLLNMTTSMAVFFDPHGAMTKREFAAHNTRLVLKAVSPGGLSVSDSRFRELDASVHDHREILAARLD